MKYIHRQKHRFTCGAVALANAHRKLGRHVTYKEALDMFGGLKAFDKSKKKKHRGISNAKFIKVARKTGLHAEQYHLTYDEVRMFSRLKDLAIAVCYSGLTKKGVYSHVVTLNRRGQSLNGKLMPHHWDITRKVQGFDPIVIVMWRK